MNPLTVNPLAVLGGAVLVAAIGFGAGWQTNGWRLNTELSEQKAARAEEKAKASDAALADLTAASKIIKEQASAARVDVGNIHHQLAAIRKERQNAKPTPLPPDCRMDDVRVRSLEAAAAAVDQTILGSKPSR